MDLEISLVRVFGWSLREIDETAVESLLPFIRRLTAVGPQTADPAGDHRGTSSRPVKQVYIDQVMHWFG